MEATEFDGSCIALPGWTSLEHMDHHSYSSLVWFPKAVMLNHGCTWKAFIKTQKCSGSTPNLLNKTLGWSSKVGICFLNPNMFPMHIGLGTMLKGKVTLLETSFKDRVQGDHSRGPGPFPPGHLVLILLHLLSFIFFPLGKNEMHSCLQGSQDQTHKGLNE